MKRIRRTAIIIHFLIVIITVSHLYEVIHWRPLSSLMEAYSSVTYTNRNFGFFAPTVNEDFNLNLRVFKNNDSIGHNFLFPVPNTENKIRFSTMLWHFTEGNSDSQMDLYAKSWGVYCMNMDNTITKVRISVSKNYIPTMSEYNEGKRISQNLYYQTTIDGR